MKTSNLLFMLFVLPLIFAGCEKVDLRNGQIQEKGLLNFAVAIPGQATEYSATVAGPYNDGDTVYVKVPTTEENPLDVTGLKPKASLENNSRMMPALNGTMDFSKPLEVTVVNGAGISKRHIIKIVPTLPRTVFSKSWFKLSADLGILRTNIPGIAVVGDNLLVADFNGGSTIAAAGVKVYDRITGAFKKDIAPPTTYCMQVVADDAGHFIVNRYNIYSAGFVVYRYDNIDAAPVQILNYTAAQGCPVNLGRKVTVKGDLKQGKAYVYATTNGNNDIFYWQFQDGVPVNNLPTILKYAGAPAWLFANVERKSLEDNSDHYLTYCNYVSPDASLVHGSRFLEFNTSMDVIQMNTQNHYYKILDFEVFEIGKTVFMAALTQGYYAWDATHIKVYDITDPENMKLVSGSEGYGDFMLFTSEAYGGTNYNRWGDIAVSVNGNMIDIYSSMATNATSTSGIMSYRMKYNP